MAVRTTTLLHWSGPVENPEFAVIQGRMALSRPEEWERLRSAAVTFAVGAGDRGFTAEEVAAYLGRGTFRPNTLGAVICNLCRNGQITAIGRERSRHPEAHGRSVYRFVLASRQRPPLGGAR